MKVYNADPKVRLEQIKSNIADIEFRKNRKERNKLYTLKFLLNQIAIRDEIIAHLERRLSA